VSLGDERKDELVEEARRRFIEYRLDEHLPRAKLVERGGKTAPEIGIEDAYYTDPADAPLPEDWTLEELGYARLALGEYIEAARGRYEKRFAKPAEHS
jgi:hypothetical protein